MAKDWTNLQKKYRGMWVAFDEDEQTVLGAGRTVRDTVKEARKKSKETPFLIYMPEEIKPYVG